jgi:multicomponent Na+:H+ antiporter subunit F
MTGGPTDMTLTCTVAMGTLAASMILVCLRLVRGPSILDRVMALDLLTTLALGELVVYAIGTGQAVLLDIGIAFALISFLGTVAFARYLEREVTG